MEAPPLFPTVREPAPTDVKVTTDNYYSEEADDAYLNNSQAKCVRECEQMYHAKYVDRSYKESVEDSIALNLGTLTDCMYLTPDELPVLQKVRPWLWKDPTRDDVKAQIDKSEHRDRIKSLFPELFSSRGKTAGQLKSNITVTEEMEKKFPKVFKIQGPLKAQYAIVDEMLRALQAQPFLESLMDCEHQVALTGTLNGMRCRALVDAIDPSQGLVIDLKTTRSIREDVWSAKHGQKVPFYERYNYWAQMALYCHLAEQTYRRPFKAQIVAVSKPSLTEKVADVELLQFDDPHRMSFELNEVAKAFARIGEIRSGHGGGLYRCENCDACRQTKVIVRPKSALSIEPRRA